MDSVADDNVTEESPKEFDRLVQKERRLRLSPATVVSSFALVLLSWSAFNWLRLTVVLSELLPYLVVAIGLCWLLDLLLKWQGVRRFWLIETDGRGVVGYVALTAILIAAGPAFANLHGVWLARSFISAFDIGVAVESQGLVLIERETKPAEPYLFRGVTTVYRLLDSVEDVDARLREWLDDKEWWRLSKSSFFWGSCDRDRVGRYVTMFLTQGEDLQMAVHYGVPDYSLSSTLG